MVWVFVIKKRKKVDKNKEDREQSVLEDEYQPMASRTKILLLYPKDCEDFMETMEAFRKILIKHENFQIFDAFDEKNVDVIFQNPDLWLQKRLKDSKIILILTKIGEILIENPKISLYKPRYMSSLNQIFLKGVLEIFRRNCKNIFLVQFDLEKSKFEDFNAVSLKKFVLPENYKELYKHLEKSADAEFDDALFYEFLLKYEKFKMNCLENPNYLEDIINVKVI